MYASVELIFTYTTQNNYLLSTITALRAIGCITDNLR